MIITHCGKFGDFCPSLIIPNYYYKNNKEKTTFILSSWFKSIVGLEEFLLNQKFTERVIFDPYMPENFNYGAQPYQFTPASIKNGETYYNLGIHGSLNRYLGVMYAEEHNLNYDLDIDLDFVDVDFPEEYRNLKVYTHFYDDRWDKDRYELRFTELLPMEGYVPFDPNKSILHNLNVAYYAQEAVFYPNGFSVLANICKIKMSLVNGSVNPVTYYINL